MVNFPKNYFINKVGEELSSDEVAELLKISVTAYDMFLVRNNLHTLRTKIDGGLNNISLCLEDIKNSLEVEFKNGSIKKSKINDVILEHHFDIKEVKKIVSDLDNRKQDKGFIKTTIKNVNWWADNIIKIVLLLTAILGYFVYNDLATVVKNLPR